MAKKEAKKEARKTLGQTLSELEKITQWFDEQQDIDIEEGMTQVKAGVGLVKDAKKRLGNIENEFIDLKKSLED